MIRRIYLSLTVLLVGGLMAFLAGCDNNDMDKGDLKMDGDAFITSFSINDSVGTIDQQARTIKVMLAPKTDLKKLVPVFTLSPGADSDIPGGSAVDFTAPVTFKVTNGNVYTAYTVTARCYEAKILTFTFTDRAGNNYPAVIDEENHKITVDLPDEADPGQLTASYTLSEGAEASPVSGITQDFSKPVVYTVTNHGDKAEYTVKAVATDMPVTAFIGTAATVDGLKSEEKAAAEWMLANVPRSRYISMLDIKDGKVVLDPSVIKALWWHGDDANWPSEAWDSRDKVKEYYANGGNLFLSRYACRYVNDVYQISLDMKQPNAESKNESASPLAQALGFTVDDAAHPIFKDLSPAKDQPVYLLDAGNSTYNCRVDWNLYDYSPDHSLASWEKGTGAKRLAYETDDSNKTAIVEFPARNPNSGKVILVGTGAFEWGVTADNANQYAKNRQTLTMNILRYLVGLNK